jgi:hypothetical protein
MSGQTHNAKWTRQTVFLISSIVLFMIISSWIVVRSINNGDENDLEIVDGMLALILIVCFLPTILAIAKIFHHRRVGWSLTFFVFIGCGVTPLFVVSAYFTVAALQRHQAYIDPAAFSELISEYNRHASTATLDLDLIGSFIKNNKNCNGILIVDINQSGKLNVRPFNYYYLNRKYKSQYSMPNNTKDIGLVITIGPRTDEFYGYYSDNITKAYRELVRVNAYKLKGNLLDLDYKEDIRGDEPPTHVPAKGEMLHSDAVKGPGLSDSQIDEHIMFLIKDRQ